VKQEEHASLHKSSAALNRVVRTCGTFARNRRFSRARMYFSVSRLSLSEKGLFVAYYGQNVHYKGDLNAITKEQNFNYLLSVCFKILFFFFL